MRKSSARTGIITFRRRDLPDVSADAVLSTVATAVVVVDAEGVILYVNDAAEHLLRGSVGLLRGTKLQDLVPQDSPIFALLRQVLAAGHPVSENHITLTSPRIGEHLVNVHAAPLPEVADAVVLSLHERTIAAKIDRSLTYRGAARSVAALAATLALGASLLVMLAGLLVRPEPAAEVAAGA